MRLLGCMALCLGFAGYLHLFSWLRAFAVSFYWCVLSNWLAGVRWTVEL